MHSRMRIRIGDLVAQRQETREGRFSEWQTGLPAWLVMLWLTATELSHGVWLMVVGHFIVGLLVSDPATQE